MALPVWKDRYCWVLLKRMVRMTTLKSKSPSAEKYPIAPEYTPRRDVSYLSHNFMAEIFGAPVIEPAGKVFRITSVSVRLSSISQDTVEIIWWTCSKV